MLTAVYAADAPAWLRDVPAVETLRRVWARQYHLVAGAVTWRAAEDIPPSAVFSSSPYDTDAHDARKRTTQWVGDKVHVTETCDEGSPRLITHVSAGEFIMRAFPNWCGVV